MISAHSKFAEIKTAFQLRNSLSEFTNAYRLFNGFYEGYNGLVIDRYGETLVIFDHGIPGKSWDIIDLISQWATAKLEGINAIFLKQRGSQDQGLVKGHLISGEKTQNKINEYGVTYALDLKMNQDASFYLDTRYLRRWLLEHGLDWSVLNTFAYTGSLGVAAGKGGAALVVQTDLNSNFLTIARKSWQMNDLSQEDCRIVPGDFFRVMSRLRHANQLFDCVILDPPFFSTTEAGRVDLLDDFISLINKVRPLVAHQGYLILINNALFLSGEDYMKQLQALCDTPYLSLETILPVPRDITGYPETIVDTPPADPTPFNHPTKITILRVFRKDKRISTKGKY